MKKELAALLALFILIGPTARAQDDNLSEAEMEDLSSMMGDEAPSNTEVSVESVNAGKTESNVVAEEAPVEEAAPAEEAAVPVEATALEKLPAEDTMVEKAQTETTDADLENEFNPNDELESLKSDVGDVDFEVPKQKTEEIAEEKPSNTKDGEEKVSMGMEVFDVGNEEKELVEVAKNLSGQLSNNEWNEIATSAKVNTYTVVRNDWLFKISKRLFGTGYYYPKIWSLNSYITNPHLIEPGMVLSFTTGSAGLAPDVKLGTFTDDELKAQPG